MGTSSPSPFPKEGIRQPSRAEMKARFAAFLCAFRLKKMPSCTSSFMVLMLSFALISCDLTRDVSVMYTAFNYTDKGIVAIAVNGEGGILHASENGGGGSPFCCVTLPMPWHQGLTAEIAWRNAGKFQRDEAGNLAKDKDGNNILIEAPWQTRTVEVAKYTKQGDFQILFFPDDIKVVVMDYAPWGEEHPYHDLYLKYRKD